MMKVTFVLEIKEITVNEDPSHSQNSARTLPRHFNICDAVPIVKNTKEIL
jgi:hypothetical protein